MKGLLAFAMLLTAGPATADQTQQDDVWKLERIRGQYSAVLESTPDGGLGRKSKQKIVLKCDGTGHLTSHGVIAVRGPITVRYKFGEKYDRAPTFTEHWNLTKDRRAVVVEPGEFLDEVRSGKDFLVEITDKRGLTYMSWFANSASPTVEYVLGGCR